MDRCQLAITLNQLLAYLYESRDCMSQALQQLSDMQLKNILTSFINQRRLLIESLSNEVRKLNEDVIDNGSWRETVQWVYLDITNILNAQNFENIVHEIKRAEQRFIQHYHNVLKGDLPNNVKLTLMQHLTELEGNFIKLETLITLNV